MKPYAKNPKVIIATLLVAAGIGLLTYQKMVFAGPGHDEAPDTTDSAATPTSIAIETASNGGVEALGATSVSWAGEVLSTADVQIYPAREGQIAEWKVRLGDKVRKGQVLGRLTAPPVSLEATLALAERSQALVRARAQAAATEKLVRDGKARLAVLKEKLGYSRDTALALIDTEAEKNIQSAQGAGQQLQATTAQQEAAIAAAQAEVAQAQALVPLKRQAARVAFDRLSTRFAGAISNNGITPSSPEFAAIQFNRFYGISVLSTRDEFIWSFQALLRALKDTSTLPEKEALNYAAAVQKLLSASFADEQELTSAKLNEVRDIISDDKESLLTALKEYKEAETALSVAESSLIKTTAESNNQVVDAQVAAQSARLTVQSTERQKQNKSAETDLEYAREVSDLDSKIAELEREISLAQADVQSAGAAYSILASGAAGQTIVAAQDGTISSLFKNIGDRVTPETAIGGISSASAKGRFVRLRIPSDMRTPQAGEEVQIERPGFPLTPVKAKIIGVGLALDQQGSYSADAEFLTPTDWPVHASVRVIGKQSNNSILVPLTAIWWNEKGVSQVWLVTESNVIRPQEVKVGRAIGDRIQVEEGLDSGSRFVMKAAADLKTGQSVTELAPQAAKQPSAEPAGDGHGHSHDE